MLMYRKIGKQRDLQKLVLFTFTRCLHLVPPSINCCFGYTTRNSISWYLLVIIPLVFKLSVNLLVYSSRNVPCSSTNLTSLVDVDYLQFYIC